MARAGTTRVDFHDVRGGQVVFVPHCALNQNARLAGCAECPAAVGRLIAGLIDRGLGIVQLPCPELRVLGLDREQVDIRAALEAPAGRAALRAMAREVAGEIAQYRCCGLTVLGILGKNGSPSCGVEQTYAAGGHTPGRGVFIEELAAELTGRGIDVPLRGMIDTAPGEALAVVDGWQPAGGRAAGPQGAGGS